MADPFSPPFDASLRREQEYDSVKPTVIDVMEAVNEKVEEESSDVFADAHDPCPTSPKKAPRKIFHSASPDDRYISLVGAGGTLLKASASCRLARVAFSKEDRAVAKLAAKYPNLAMQGPGSAQTT